MLAAAVLGGELHFRVILPYVRSAWRTLVSIGFDLRVLDVDPLISEALGNSEDRLLVGWLFRGCVYSWCFLLRHASARFE